MAHRKGRSLLTGAGIVLGVAILFGVLVANATTQKGVDLLIEDFTGRADVVAGPVGSFDAKLPAGLPQRLAALPEVKDVVAEYGFRTSLADHPSEDDPDEPTGIGVAGVTFADARKIQDFAYLEGRAPRAGRNEIALSTRLAERIDVGPGDKLEVQGKAATRNLVVVGILEATGAGRAGDGQQTYTSIETARALAGEPPGAFNNASVILDDGVDADRWIARHRDAIEGARLQNAETIAAGFKEFLAVFGTFLTFFATITLFVGAFLIYLTLSMAVIERTRMYGTLRALGATRKQVRRVVLTEALALGAVSTVVGLLVGLALALGLLQLIAAVFELDMPGLVVQPSAALASIVVGLVVTTASALVPAVRAGRLAPVEAMKGDYGRDLRLGRGWIVGTVTLALSGVVAVLVDNSAPLVVIGVLLGSVLVVPLLLRPLASLLGRVTNRLARGVGEIAVLHLAKERSRSAYTLALVMVVMAMLFATGGMFLSVRASINDLVEEQFGADLFVGSRVPDDGTLGRTLTARDDIDIVSPLRVGIATTKNPEGENEEIFVRTIEPRTYFDVTGFSWEDGDERTARDALSRGGRILLTDEVATRFGVQVGDPFTLETSKGFAEFEIAATYVGPFGPPELTIGLDDARRHLSVGRPEGYVVKVREGQKPAEVGRRLEDIPGRQLETETQAELKEAVSGEIVSFFRVIYAILLVAAIVGLLGLANTLAMSVLHRFREIGILRAIGVTRSQTWRMVLVESATMGLTAFVLALPLGWVLTFLVSQGASEGFGGDTLRVVYPWAWIPFVFLFGMFVSAIAAIAPGRRAARLHVVSALQYE